jgi:hypothetical protein
MEKRFTRGRKRITKESKRAMNHNSPMENYILYKRKPVRTKFLTWGIWFEVQSRNRGRVLKRTQVADDIQVSTIFMGIDRHNLFETMIFGGHHGGYQDRYYTYEEALAGHQRACELAFEVPQ